MAEEKDQVVSDIIEGDKSDNKVSEETAKESPTLEKLAEVVQGLQKGYTVTRQEFAEVKDNLQTIADATNAKSGAEQGTDEYVTVGKLKEVLAEYDQSKIQAQQAGLKEADRQIEESLAGLEADGIVSSDKEKNDLLQFAVDNKILDLNKAAARWIKGQGSEKSKEVAKAKVRQEEGSKVGTSSTNAGEESKGVDYAKVQEMRRDFGF